MPIATFWTAIAAAATIAAAGVTGVVSKQPILGWFLVLISVGLAASLGMWRHIETRSIARFTMWLRREANYGTTNIQHAAVQTAEDVSRLAAAFAAWETTVERVVNFYCSDADASRIEYLDNWSSRSLSGLNADHCHVLENVAEMVARMRLLLPRLESRETTLRRIVPEGVLDMRVDQLAPTNPDLGQAQRDTQRLGIEIIGLIAIVVTMLLTASSVVYLRGSVVATENSYKVGNRAWVGPSTDESTEFRLTDERGNELTTQSFQLLEEGKRYGVQIFLKNAGKSPALRVKHKAAVVFSSAIPTKSRDAATFVNDTIIFPNATIGFVSALSLPLQIRNEQERDRASGPERAPGLFVAATICYRDVFHDLHYVKPCRVLGSNLPGHFGYCEHDSIEENPADAKVVCGE